MAERANLAAVGGFSALARPTATTLSAGLTATERRGLGLAVVTLRRGARHAFAARLSDLFGIALAEGPKVSGNDDIGFVGTGPASFLAVQAGGGWRFAMDLGEQLQGVASVCDQSSGYAALRLTGPKLRQLLAKGVPIDLHPAAFAPGDAAVTLASHVGIVLWQVDAAPTFDVAVPRSYAASVWHWLEASAAEFGLSVAEPVS